MSHCIDLIEYAKLGMTRRVKRILDEGKDLGHWNAALCIAAERGDLDMVKVLVKAGASLNFVDYCGYTPLMYAKENEDAEMQQYIENCLAD